MATIQTFTELEVWQKARAFAKDIYDLTLIKPFAVDFELRNQIRRSSGSIMDNIAEGFERGGKLEFINFLTIAKGSCGETQSQLYRAFDRNYIINKQLEQLLNKANQIGKMIGGFINYLNGTDIKGRKYKNRIPSTQNPKP